MIKMIFYGTKDDLKHLQAKASIFIHSRAFYHQDHHLLSGDTIQDDRTSDHSYLPFTDAILKLVDHADISIKESKYQDSMPPFEGFARYIPPLCGDIVVKALTF
ncbi:hypothetical protein HanXRQr2_Chr04g0163391 [Helianthus annuus]|uniref:Uncharacterized protein n=2 Tax=Helianthus annuus TaxID=4232 RepID=A0A9K3J7S5_HELAN|nr:hypothetical protein HanXRQr2_Chr04g0163391 [Helianthus annuus]